MKDVGRPSGRVSCVSPCATGQGWRPGSSSPAQPACCRRRKPAWPGGYDFARDAYYKGIGAVGSMVGPVRRLDPPPQPDWSLWLAARVDEARNALTQRIAVASAVRPVPSALRW